MICLLSYFRDRNITEISLVSTKISLKDVGGVSFGPLVETTELLDMSNRTVK